MRIKDWDKFQHYKDRKPPWIRLYRDLLDDPQWHRLDGDDAKILIMLWLIASENSDLKSGELPDIGTLAFRLRFDIDELRGTLERLSRHWIVADASTMLADRYHDATPEAETEAEVPMQGEVPYRGRGA